MKKMIVFAALCAAVTAGATQFSKLSIVTAAENVDKWGALKEWIAQAGLQDKWDAASYLSDDYPQYASITNILVECGVLTPAELRYILEASVDTAIPDAALRRVYDADMSNDTGRVRWHGKVKQTVIDTNALTRVRVYADGWTFTDKFKPTRPPSVERRLSEEERKRLAKERDRKRKEARLEYLLTHEADEIARLSKTYPPMLAALLYTNDLNNAKSAVAEFHPVTADVTPQ